MGTWHLFRNLQGQSSLGDTGEDMRVDKKLCSENINRIKLELDGLKWWNILNTEINYSIL